MTINQDNTNGEYGNSNSEIDTPVVCRPLKKNTHIYAKSFFNEGDKGAIKVPKIHIDVKSFFNEGDIKVPKIHIDAKSFLNEGEIKPVHKPRTRIGKF